MSTGRPHLRASSTVDTSRATAPAATSLFDLPRGCAVGRPHLLDLAARVQEPGELAVTPPPPFSILRRCRPLVVCLVGDLRFGCAATAAG